MQWALAVTIIVGTLPGIFLGAFVRIRYLPDPRASKLVVGLVLLYLAGRLLSNRQPPELLPATTAARCELARYRLHEFTTNSRGEPSDSVQP
jgi:hypothetical protein